MTNTETLGSLLMLLAASDAYARANIAQSTQEQQLSLIKQQTCILDPPVMSAAAGRQCRRCVVPTDPKKQTVKTAVLRCAVIIAASTAGQ